MPTKTSSRTEGAVTSRQSTRGAPHAAESTLNNRATTVEKTPIVPGPNPTIGEISVAPTKQKSPSSRYPDDEQPAPEAPSKPPNMATANPTAPNVNAKHAAAPKQTTQTTSPPSKEKAAYRKQNILIGANIQPQ